jgi:hypothetical protein
MPDEKIKYVNTRGGTSDAFGDIDAAASLEQIPGVYKPPKPPSTKVTSLDTGNYGGINNVTIIQPNTDDVTVHESSGRQLEITGDLLKPKKDYSY